MPKEIYLMPTNNLITKIIEGKDKNIKELVSIIQFLIGRGTNPFFQDFLDLIYDKKTGNLLRDNENWDEEQFVNQMNALIAANFSEDSLFSLEHGFFTFIAASDQIQKFIKTQKEMSINQFIALLDLPKRPNWLSKTQDKAFYGDAPLKSYYLPFPSLGENNKEKMGYPNIFLLHALNLVGLQVQDVFETIEKTKSLKMPLNPKSPSNYSLTQFIKYIFDLPSFKRYLSSIASELPNNFSIGQFRSFEKEGSSKFFKFVVFIPSLEKSENQKMDGAEEMEELITFWRILFEEIVTHFHQPIYTIFNNKNPNDIGIIIKEIARDEDLGHCVFRVDYIYKKENENQSSVDIY